MTSIWYDNSHITCSLIVPYLFLFTYNTICFFSYAFAEKLKMEIPLPGFAIATAALSVGYVLMAMSVSKNTIIPTDILDAEYDYIIVGAGSAGSVLAARLSEDQDKTVLLLEVGKTFDNNPLFHVPMYAAKLQHTEYDWEYYTEPQKFSQLGLNENRGYMPRGKVLGGTNMLNYLQYTRGSKYEFDEWSKNGCIGWSYKDVLPYFLKSEDILIEDLKTSPYHSSGGPLAVSDGKATPLADLYIRAGKEAGYNCVDYNGADQEGLSYIQLSSRNGVRSSSSKEMLKDIGDRKNLHIAVESFVTKIEIQEQRAVGVQVIRKLRKSSIYARKEIIVSAGAINSPQVLMLSGIGPKEHLQDIGIPVKADLPVGQNLQDHQVVPLFTKINGAYGITESNRESMWSKVQYRVFGTGPLSVTGEATGFFYAEDSMRGKDSADVQFVLWSLLPHDNIYNYKDEVAKEILAKGPNENGFFTIVRITHPKSTGIIKLRSVDPYEHPFIDPKYLTKQDDIDGFIAGIRIWEKVIETTTMRTLGAQIEQANVSFCSEHEFRSDDFWECYTRHLAVNAYHQSGTCKMGAEDDRTAVVDPHLRVKGIKGLRVVDASVFPSVTSGNTNAPVIMVAEKISDDIRGTDSVFEIRNKLKKLNR